MSLLGPVPRWTDQLFSAASACGENISAAVELARRYGTQLALPGRDTHVRWSVLAGVAAMGLTPARVFEAHTDALAILTEAGELSPSGLAFGVFAADAPDAKLTAKLDERSGRAVLRGVKPWCSVAADLDAALVTAHTPHGRQLFQVELNHPSVRVGDVDSWVARGLRTVVSTPVAFDDTPATPIGAPTWYLIRPGFAWGGMGVAACWFGGAAPLLDRLRTRVAERGDDLDAMHLGQADIALHAARVALSDAAALIDAGRAGRREGEMLALRVRAIVAAAVEQVSTTTVHALGPAPLTFDPDVAARIADLGVYVRQHHAERDLAALGSMSADSES